MTTYSVHILDTATKSDVALVPDRFSWMAAVFGFVWALFIGAWDLALALFAVQVLAGMAIPLLGLSEAAQGFAQLGVAAAIGFGAFELRRWLLGLRGYRETDVVTGPGAEEAERRYFDSHPDVTARLLGAAS
jgi:hypothetical protein